ncbi:MAG: hypothetical protein Q8O94_02800 [bacterium]|nr:hypothetical protein [bacterium]
MSVFTSTPIAPVESLVPSAGRRLVVTDLSYFGQAPDAARVEFLLTFGGGQTIAEQGLCTSFDGSSPGPFIGEINQSVEIVKGVSYSTVIFEYEESA